MRIFVTEYEKDGMAHEGPLILAPTWELALEQAEHCNIKLVGELEGFYNSHDYPEVKKRTIH